jgi:hypothetical protein
MGHTEMLLRSRVSMSWCCKNLCRNWRAETGRRSNRLNVPAVRFLCADLVRSLGKWSIPTQSPHAGTSGLRAAALGAGDLPGSAILFDSMTCDYFR